MRFETLYRRSLVFRWRTHLATALAVAVAAAVLTGALLVGDSMRGSLRGLALDRLGRIDHALVSERFFREQLAAELPGDACPVILLRGGVEHAESNRRVGRVNVLGIDERFGRFADGEACPAVAGRSIVLNESLAHELGAGPGDDVLLRLQRRTVVPVETLLGRRDDQTLSLRLTVKTIVAGGGLADFTLTPTQHGPFNAFVPLVTLQRAIKREGRVNALFVAGAADRDALQQSFDSHLALHDWALKLRVDSPRGYVALESDRLLIEPVVEAAVMAAVDASGVDATPVLSYLANTIETVRPPATAPSNTPAAVTTTIPYSTVTAIDVKSAGAAMTLVDGQPAPPLRADEMFLNEWAADDLQARPSDTIMVTYYVTGAFGKLSTESTGFTLRGIVRMGGLPADRGLVPEYEGVTDAKSLSDWDPPFPIDLTRIREKDEAYWDDHGPTPKAFVPLAAGQALWTRGHERFGRLTSIRIEPAPGEDLAATADAFEGELLTQLGSEATGMTFEPIRARALSAAKGSTDFAMLFVGFSLFLIVSAALLVALLFRLGIERRTSEMGLLLAVGYTPRDVSRLLLAEGLCVAGVGTAIGLVGAIGYAWLMLAGLRSWWSAAVSAPFLRLHLTSTSLLIGLAASLLVAFASIAWAVHGLSRTSPRSLLAGMALTSPGPGDGRRSRMPGLISALSVSVAAVLVLLSIVTEAVPQAPAFFASGAAMLAACLAGLAAWTARPGADTTLLPGSMAVARLGVRNAARNPRRSLLTAGLIASATFIIVAVGVNRRETHDAVHESQSGTGGFTLMAESAVPVLHDLNAADGRDALSLPSASVDALADATVVPFRLRPGDESSCLNLYRPRSPRILGATDAMIGRGGFEFHSSLAETDDDKRNPWTLLDKELASGAIPVIGDYNSVKWLLHLGLGQDLTITDERGNPVRLRIVAMLAGSVLQGELIMAESRFVEQFPSIAGYSFFLIESPPALAEPLGSALERDLSDCTFDVTATADRLRQYMAIENTYLSTFQTLGGLGLVLGTFGLAAVLLRNVWERRAELALMQALGYRRFALAWMVMVENWVLLLSGLAAGMLSACLAVAPHVMTTPATVPWASVGLTLLAVLAAGTLAGILPLISTLRAPLMPALRRE